MVAAESDAGIRVARRSQRRGRRDGVFIHGA
jgi:hypothetical protein